MGVFFCLYLCNPKENNVPNQSEIKDSETVTSRFTKYKNKLMDV